MASESSLFFAGQIVLADWRAGALPKEPNKKRPAIIIEEDNLLPPAYPNILVVPLTSDENLAIPDLSLQLKPNSENGCPKACFVLSNLVTSASKQRLTPTNSFITKKQLTTIREQIALSIGL